MSTRRDSTSSTRIFDLGAIWRRLTYTEARALEGGAASAKRITPSI
jgi:hypothetical protein